MHDDDYVSAATMAVLEHLQNMYDEFEQDPSSSAVYASFVEYSHAYVAHVKSSCDEHEYYLIRDVHYDLIHEAFVKHFKKKT
jgi:hypothetical protein